MEEDRAFAFVDEGGELHERHGAGEGEADRQCDDDAGSQYRRTVCFRISRLVVQNVLDATSAGRL